MNNKETWGAKGICRDEGFEHEGLDKRVNINQVIYYRDPFFNSLLTISDFNLNRGLSEALGPYDDS